MNHTPNQSAIDLWLPSQSDYDRSIHSNPDAKAWADLFVQVFPGLKDKHDLMLGWFSNAMMAMYDHIHSQPNPLAEKLSAVTAQRDELLAAISKCLSESNACVGGIVEIYAQLGKIRAISNAAIAKCEVQMVNRLSYKLRHFHGLIAGSMEAKQLENDLESALLERDALKAELKATQSRLHEVAVGCANAEFELKATRNQEPAVLIEGKKIFWNPEYKGVHDGVFYASPVPAQQPAANHEGTNHGNG